MNGKNSIFDSFSHAWSGLAYAFMHNRNLRFHFSIAIFVIVLSLAFGVNGFEKGILGVMILLVISTEMINSSIEEMTNLITTEHRREAKIAKDVSAGMVLVTSLGSVIVGTLIFLPYVLKLLGLG